MQNTGEGNVYFCFAADCDINTKNFHGMLLPGEQLDVTAAYCRVSCMGAADWQISTAIFLRTSGLNSVAGLIP